MVRSLLGTLLKIAGAGTVGWLAYSRFGVNHDMPIGPAIDAERLDFSGPSSCFLSYYVDTSGNGRPLVLLHSINAAASAYEVMPIFNHYRGLRPVYALDLPGFGFSERSDREYSPELYSNAIIDFLNLIGDQADVIAMSLTCEFAGLAAEREPGLFHTLTMISPSGFSTQTSQRDEEASDTAYNLLTNPVTAQPLFDLLTTRASIAFFLSQSFYGPADQGMIDYAYLTAHQTGARYAPLYFVSGKLFTPNIAQRVYADLELPVMVLYDQDQFVDLGGLTRFAEQHNNWRLRRIPNTRGLPHFERMDKVAEALNSFWIAVHSAATL